MYSSSSKVVSISTLVARDACRIRLGRFQAVQHRHLGIHQHHAGTKARDHADRLQPVGRLADHVHPRFMVENDADAVADKGWSSATTIVIRSAWATDRSVLLGAWALPGRAWAATGIILAAGLSAFAAVLVLGFTHTGHPHGGVAAAAGVLAMAVPIAWAYRAPMPTLAVLLAAAVLNGLVFGSMVRCGGTLPALFTPPPAPARGRGAGVPPCASSWP